MSNSRKKLTKSAVEAEQAGNTQRFVWDTEQTGFGVKIFTSGTKSFVFQYRTAEGVSKRYSIGKYSDTLTVDQARKIAIELHRNVLNGLDPQGVKHARREAPILDQVFDDYLASDAFKEKATSTRGVDTGRINHHLRPLLGKVYADKLTTDEVRRMVKTITEGGTQAKVKTKARGLARVGGGAGTAKKAFALLRAICKWSSSMGHPAGNSVEWGSIKTVQDGQRDAILESAEDYTQVFTTLENMQNEKRIRPTVADAIRFIALTGARRSEVTGLRWKHVDLKKGQIILPASSHKGGKLSGKAKTLMLPGDAQEIIARQPEGAHEDYVFKASKGDGPIELNKPWRAVRTEAGIGSDIGLHNLRHSVGSHLAMGQATLTEIMTQLGHTDPKTSLRYIHFAEQSRSNLAERAASVAVAGMKGTAQSSNITPMTKEDAG